jgi:hypothetical protein
MKARSPPPYENHLEKQRKKNCEYCSTSFQVIGNQLGHELQLLS